MGAGVKSKHNIFSLQRSTNSQFLHSSHAEQHGG